MNTFVASSRTRWLSLLVSSLLLALLPATTFLPFKSVHAAPSPPPPARGSFTATAEVHVIPEVTEVTEFVYPQLGTAQGGCCQKE